MENLLKVTIQLCLGLLIAVTVGCSRNENKMTLTDTDKSEFKVGQVWRYKTRLGEENSELAIVKVESEAKLGVIVHISLNGLKFKNPHLPNGIQDKMLHFPFAEQAIKDSVVTMIREDKNLPEFQSGYSEWLAAFNKHGAGVFTLPVAKVLDVTEAAMNKQSPDTK